MSQKQREDDDVEEKEDGKQDGQSQQNGQSGGSGIHKYFGKSTKNIKFFSSKIKKPIKSGTLQNLTTTLEGGVNNQKDISNIQEKTKLKFQYRSYQSIWNGKPKFKFTFNPFVRAKIFQEAALNWKRSVIKGQDQNIDIKYLYQKGCLNVKYKRAKQFFKNKLKHKMEIQTAMYPGPKFRGGFTFESIVKDQFKQTHDYLNSGQLKGKLSLKQFGGGPTRLQLKLDLSEKLTFLVRQFKIKQQTNASITVGQGSLIPSIKSNAEVTNDTNTWTLYGSIVGYRWGIAFDEAKFLYSLYENWKLGFMQSQKNGWQVTLQNSKLKYPLCTSFAFYLGSKNYAFILKNKFNKKINNRSWGNLNYEISLQNALRNTQLDKVNVGLTLNLNL